MIVLERIGLVSLVGRLHRRQIEIAMRPRGDGSYSWSVETPYGGTFRGNATSADQARLQAQEAASEWHIREGGSHVARTSV